MAVARDEMGHFLAMLDPIDKAEVGKALASQSSAGMFGSSLHRMEFII